MSRRIVGTLSAPDGTPLASTTLTLVALRNEDVSVIKGSRYSFTTDGAGAYDKTILDGYYAVLLTKDGAEIRIGEIGISTGADTTLSTLLAINNTEVNPTAGALLQLVADAQTAETSAANSAAASAASAGNSATSASSSATSATNAAASATASASSATASAADRVLAESAKTGAQTAESNAVAVVSGGTATLTPEAGKIPIAGATPFIDSGWLDYNIPALSAQYPGLDIVATAFYDTSKDSDGGAWVKKTDSLSYGKEAVPSGRYLGQFSGTGNAAAAPGAAVGDWFYHTVQKSFQKFTAIPLSNNVQVIYRAGSATFPAQALIVAEAARVIIFDASGPELAMWMVFDCSGVASWTTSDMLWSGDTKTGLACSHGVLYVTNAANCPAATAEFITDSGYFHSTNVNNPGLYKGNISQRNDSLGSAQDNSRGQQLVNSAGNAVAVTVLDNAPIDPATGLQIPTVAAFTDGGISRIEHDGTVNNSADTNKHSGGYFDGNDLVATLSVFDNVRVYDESLAIVEDHWSASNELHTLATAHDAANAMAGIAGDGVNTYAGNKEGLSAFHRNPSASAKGMVAHINDKKNTGWMKDAQLAVMCETETGSMVETELVTNGDFPTDTTGWTARDGGTLAVVGGQLEITDAAGGFLGGASQSVTVTANKVHAIRFDVAAGTGTQGRIRAGDDSSYSNNSLLDQSSLAVGSHIFYITPTTSSINLLPSVAVDGQSIKFDNISVKEVVADHSGNTNHLDIKGTLTRTVIGSGELAAWSGFGAANNLTGTDPVIGSGDFHIRFHAKGSQADKEILTIGSTASTNPVNALHVWVHTSQIKTHYDGLSLKTSAVLPADTEWWSGDIVRRGDILELWINGVINTTANIAGKSISGSVLIGDGFYTGYIAGLALLRISKTAPSPDQIAKMYRDELAMIDSSAVLDGNAPDIKALAYDQERDLLRVASEGVISSFRGLERVESSLDGVANEVTNGGFDTDTDWTKGTGWTISGGVASCDGTQTAASFLTNTPALDSTKTYRFTYTITAITAGSVRPGGTAAIQSTIGTYTEVFTGFASIDLVGDLNFVGSVDNVQMYKISDAAPFKSIDASNGTLLLGGSNGFDASLPAVNIREHLNKFDRRDEYVDLWQENPVENPNFTNGSVGWNLTGSPSGWSVVGGQLVQDGTGGASSQIATVANVTLVPGETYTLRIEVPVYNATTGGKVIAVSAGGVVPDTDDRVIAQAGGADNIVNGVFTLDFVAQSTQKVFNLYARNGATCTVDNISIYPTEGLRLPHGFKPERVEIDRQTARESKGNNVYDYDLKFDGFDWVVDPVAAYDELYVRAKRAKS